MGGLRVDKTGRVTGGKEDRIRGLRLVTGRRDKDWNKG